MSLPIPLHRPVLSFILSPRLCFHSEIISGVVPTNPISRITSNRHLIRIALIAAVALGITGSTEISSDSQSTRDTGNTLRKVSAIIFLVVTALLAIHTLFLIRQGGTRPGKFHPPLLHDQRLTLHTASASSIGTSHGIHFLGLIITLLLIREIFLTVEIGKIPSEGLWYPFAALTELLAVFFFVTPGLVPEKRDLVATRNQFDKNPDTETA